MRTQKSIEPYLVLMSAALARRAIRRGDLASAERWLRVADRAAVIAQRMQQLERGERGDPRFSFNPA